MFERFRSNKDKPREPGGQLSAQVPRGMEIREDKDLETGWGMWDEATAAQELRHRNGESVPRDPATLPAPSRMAMGGFPNDAEATTLPMGLDEKTPAQRADDALNIIELHHARIAKTIRLMWGYRECSSYIAQLLMTGYDDTGHARMGFHQEAVNAMMTLGDLHDKIFGFQTDSEIGGFDGKLSTGRDQRFSR